MGVKMGVKEEVKEEVKREVEMGIAMIIRYLWLVLLWIPAVVSAQEFPYPNVPD